jgi:hypothetical protein
VKPAASRMDVRTSIDADIVSWGAVRAWPEQLAAWRKQPAPTPVPFSPALIRHSEDQTVAALWAACEAVAGVDGVASRFNDWAVIAAPRLMGRAGNAISFERYAQEGPWGISPNLIPHQSLHAMSGILSQIFQTHGPNFGVGNGPRATAEAWLTTATLLSSGVPGLFLALTGHTSEYLPGSPGGDADTRVECEAVVLLLSPETRRGRGGLHLRFCPEDLLPFGGRDSGFLASLPEYSLGQIVDELTRRDTPPAGIWRVPGAGWIEIEMR